MIAATSAKAEKPYLGDYLWLALAGIIVAAGIANLYISAMQDVSVLEKLGPMLFGLWLYGTLTRWSFRRTVWSRRRRRPAS